MTSSRPQFPHLLSILFICVLVMLGPSMLAAHAEPAADEGAVTLKVLDVTPTTVTPDATVRVEVELTNGSGEPLEAADVRLSIARYKLSTEQILENWFEGAEQIVTPLPLDTVSLDDPLEPGESRTIALSTPASELRLLPYPDAAGPRGLIVSVTDPTSHRELDAVRTFLLWFPSDEIEPLRLTILAPITGPVPTPLDPEGWGQRIADVTGPTGRLSALLAVTGARKEIAWVVDPALIAAAASGQAGDSGTVFYEQFTRSATGRDVFALDPFDPDVSALAAQGITLPPVDPASVHSAVGSTSWRDDLTLPASPVVDQATLEAAVEADRPIVVMDELPPAVPGIEPSAKAAAVIETEKGAATALLPNAELSRLLAHPSSAGLRSTFEARQLLLARLAVISQRNPLEAQHVLLTTGRDWAPDADDLNLVLDGIADSRFIETEPLSRLLGARLADMSIESVPVASEPSPDQVTKQNLEQVLDAAREISTLSQIFPDPAAFSSDFDAGLASVTSSAWRTNPTGRSRAIAQLYAYAQDLQDGLSVVSGSDLNLISDRGDLPITLRNDFDQDLTVDVALVPNDRRLSITETVSVTIPALSARSVNVPATAIGSGDVMVEVQVLAPDGSVVASPSHFKVRVRADWENLGTAILGVGLALALTFGVIRTIKRGKRPTRMEPVHPSAPESSS